MLRNHIEELMSVEITWIDEEKTIMKYDMIGTWSWDDFYPVYDRAIVEEKAQNHTVYIVVDLRQSKSMPPNMLTHVKNISDHQPDNVGVNVIISNNRFIKMMFDIAVRMHSKIAHYFQIAHTLDDAIGLIQTAKQRETQF